MASVTAVAGSLKNRPRRSHIARQSDQPCLGVLIDPGRTDDKQLHAPLEIAARQEDPPAAGLTL